MVSLFKYAQSQRSSSVIEILFFFLLYGKGNEKSNSTMQQLIFIVAKLGTILAYFYLSDQTNFFMKENRCLQKVPLSKE